MNAAVVQSFDAPPRYTTFDNPIPAPDASEVLVTVTAAALPQIVKPLANGTHYGSTGLLPFVPGVDIVGHLQNAQQSLASASMLIPLPDALDDATALDQIRQAIADFFALIAINPMEFTLNTAPLSEVTPLWNSDDKGVRLVFQP